MRLCAIVLQEGHVLFTCEKLVRVYKVVKDQSLIVQPQCQNHQQYIVAHHNQGELSHFAPLPLKKQIAMEYEPAKERWVQIIVKTRKL